MSDPKIGRSEPIRNITGQMLADVGFNPFAAGLLAESFAKKNDPNGVICFEYMGLEITLGKIPCVKRTKSFVKLLMPPQ